MPTSQPAPGLDKHYKAFISYSHSDNSAQGRKWADWLHHSLETYQIPAELVGQKNQHGEEIPAQIYPVFQDEKELSANADLAGSLQAALDSSEFLIYLSSPRSARSVYVQEEIKHFKKTGKSKRIIALILRGEPEYGGKESEQQCFPDALRHGVDADGNILYEQHEEALAADVRIPHSAEEGFTSVEAYRRHLQEHKLSTADIRQKTEEYQQRLDLAKLKIISTILGVPLGELTKRDHAYQIERIRQKNRNIKRVVTVVSALAVTATGAGIYAWTQKNEAQKNLAQTLYTSGINKLAQNEYGDPAAYIAAAVRNGSDNATQFAESMLAARDDMVLLPNLSATNAVFSPDGRYLTGFANAGNGNFQLQIWDAHGRKPLTAVPAISARQSASPVFDAKGSLYVQADDQVVRIQPGKAEATVVFKDAATPRYSLRGVSPDGNWLAIQNFDREAYTLVRTDGQGVQHSLPARIIDAAQVAFSPDGSRALLYANAQAGGSTQGQMLDLKPGQVVVHGNFTLPVQSARASWAPDGKQVLLQGGAMLVVLDVETGRMQTLATGDKRYSWARFNGDSKSVAALDYAGYDVYATADGKKVAGKPLPNDGLRKAFEADEHMSPDRSQSVASYNRQAYLQNLAGNPLLITQQVFPPDTAQVVADNTGRSLLALQQKASTISRTEVETGKHTAAFITAPEPISYFRVLPGNRVMAVSPQQTLRFFDMANGQPVGKAIPTQARNIAISADGSRVLARIGEKGFAIWNTADGSEALRYSSEGTLGGFAPDEQFRYVIIMQEKGWVLQDIASKQTLLSNTAGTPTNAMFSPDGALAAIALSSGKIDVYDIARKEKRFSIPGIATPLLRFSPDGKTLIASSDVRRLRLWNTETGKPYGQVIPVLPETLLLAYSGDSTRLFLQDTTAEKLTPSIKVIDTRSGNLISLPFAEGLFRTVQLTDQGKRVATMRKLPEGVYAGLWQVPGSLKLAPDQLADDLETFYGKKYDPDTGAINAHTGQRSYNTWFFQDVYTRPISPDSGLTVVQAIERLLPVQQPDGLQLLMSTYFFHPLARAGLAEYFASQPGADALARELVRMTELQLTSLPQGALREQVGTVLSRAKKTLG